MSHRSSFLVVRCGSSCPRLRKNKNHYMCAPLRHAGTSTHGSCKAHVLQLNVILWGPSTGTIGYCRDFTVPAGGIGVSFLAWLAQAVALAPTALSHPSCLQLGCDGFDVVQYSATLAATRKSCIVVKQFKLLWLPVFFEVSLRTNAWGI